MATGTKVEFRVKATGDDLQFQWQKDYTDLSDGGRYCNTEKDTLCIVDVEKGDKGRYRCCVKNNAGITSFSDEALLTVSKLIFV